MVSTQACKLLLDSKLQCISSVSHLVTRFDLNLHPAGLVYLCLIKPYKYMRNRNTFDKFMSDKKILIQVNMHGSCISLQRHY